MASSARTILAGAVERGVGDLLEQRVGLAVDHAIALLDRGAADRLREMALAGAGRPEEEHVLALARRSGAVASSWISARFIFLLKVEIEGVERAVGVAEARLLEAARRRADPGGAAARR